MVSGWSVMNPVVNDIIYFKRDASDTGQQDQQSRDKKYSTDCLFQSEILQLLRQVRFPQLLVNLFHHLDNLFAVKQIGHLIREMKLCVGVISTAGYYQASTAQVQVSVGVNHFCGLQSSNWISSSTKWKSDQTRLYLHLSCFVCQVFTDVNMCVWDWRLNTTALQCVHCAGDTPYQ